MIVEREWSDVRPGDWVYDAAGTPWLMKLRDQLGNVRLERQDGTQQILARPSGRTRIWDGSPEAEALEGFRAVLGGTVLLDRH